MQLIYFNSDWYVGRECKTSVEADIVILVDGSWSIGRQNFKTIRSFISRTVEVFDIGPDKVQIGKSWNYLNILVVVFSVYFVIKPFFPHSALAQYSGDPRTEWQLNTHATKQQLLDAVTNLPYKGGNTRTGRPSSNGLLRNYSGKKNSQYCMSQKDFLLCR